MGQRKTHQWCVLVILALILGLEVEEHVALHNSFKARETVSRKNKQKPYVRYHSYNPSTPSRKITNLRSVWVVCDSDLGFESKTVEGNISDKHLWRCWKEACRCPAVLAWRIIHGVPVVLCFKLPKCGAATGWLRQWLLHCLPGAIVPEPDLKCPIPSAPPPLKTI